MPGGVEQVEQRVALAAGEREVGVGGQPARGVPRAAQHRVGDRGPDAGDQGVAQRTHAGGEARAAPRRPCSTAERERREQGGVERAGPHPALLPAAVQHGRQVEPAARQQRPGAARAADLVPADRHRVEPRRAEVDRHLPDGLHRVGVHGHAVPAGERDHVVERLQRADLVVRPHHGDQRAWSPCARAPRAARRPRRTPSASTGSSTSSAPACSAIQNAGSSTAWCSTADTRRRRRRGSCVASGPEQALDREVVRLGAARGPDDLAGPRPEGRGEPLPGLLDHAAGRAAGRVQGRGVAGAHELLGEHPRGLREHGRGRRMVEIHAHRLQSTNRDAAPTAPVPHAAWDHPPRAARELAGCAA